MISPLGSRLIIVVSIFYGLALPIAALRIWARRITKQRLVANDYLAVATAICLVAFGATAIYGVVEQGMGYHGDELTDPQNQLTMLYKLLIPLQILWALSNLAYKASMLHFYITIFQIQLFKTLALCTIGITTCYFIAVVAETLFTCQPIAYNWDHTITGHCGNQHMAYAAVGYTNLIADVVTILLPMPFLWRLQLRLAKKIILTALFGIGVVICASTLIRNVYIARWNFSDFSYGVCNVVIWSLVEPALGLICGCVPLLQPVVLKAKAATTGSKFSKPSRASDQRTKSSRDLENGQKFRRVSEDVGGTYPLTHISQDQDQDQDQDRDSETAVSGGHFDYDGQYPPAKEAMHGIRVTHDYAVERTASRG